MNTKQQREFWIESDGCWSTLPVEDAIHVREVLPSPQTDSEIERRIEERKWLFSEVDREVFDDGCRFALPLRREIDRKEMLAEILEALRSDEIFHAMVLHHGDGKGDGKSEHVADWLESRFGKKGGE